ncbi:MarR family winged helix-turn-helix transcriptional regulator [Sphingomicrobium sediminis]|uniref:MarR family transcriptional regulator n=1 Tax=Sphingomicrobium sediminis TaxID=2950949 RepID=A0A9X2J4F2_9SPHN|nr:MarR family transcriptional regulator [Sphingomicrobium sediminis]MCM8557157.1 MarR family transcriptional regulator [Sphingomicrobium sediminis]
MSKFGFHEAYLGKRLQDLLSLSHDQMFHVYRRRGLVIPVEGSSTLQAIAPGQRKAISDLSRQLGQPHQLVAQRIQKLRKMRLLEAEEDPSDRRRTEYRLTSKGEEQWNLLNALMEDAITVNRELFREIDCNLLAALERAIKALSRAGFDDRFENVDILGVGAKGLGTVS